jgi:hypothetical protein
MRQQVLYTLGYRKALLTDDIFTSDSSWDASPSARPKAPLRRGLLPRPFFGFESGNHRVLKAFGKGGRRRRL